MVDKGLLVRRRGLGTTVANRNVHRRVALSSLYDDLAREGRTPIAGATFRDVSRAAPRIPFKGGTSPLTEVLAGRVDVMIETMTLVLPHMKSGKLRGLAVTSPQPKDYLPEVPPAVKTVPGLVFQSWLGIAAPAGTPPAIVNALNINLRKTLAEPEVQKRLAALGGGAAPVSPEEMRRQVQEEIERWNKLVDSRKIPRN